MDNNGLLRRTLQAWFRHNVQPLATSKALFIHRNTLEYRLNRISELTGLDLGNLTTGCCCMWRCSWMNRDDAVCPASPYPAYMLSAVWCPHPIPLRERAQT
jgi:hypothetical protein